MTKRMMKIYEQSINENVCLNNQASFKIFYSSLLMFRYSPLSREASPCDSAIVCDIDYKF